jgi:mono/diheme cytochrome c family protein
MKPARIIATLAAATVLALPVLAAAQQQKIDIGKREYDANCAVCHGAKGKGDGPYAGTLVGTRVPDLTTLAKRNGGVYPFARMYEYVDGTQMVKAHGTREMPIWGNDYRTKAAEYYMEVPYDPEVFVRGRILALVEYMYRLQEK